jgi:xanthine dehydrogenase YagR molybdenum-binding subunit
MTPPSPRRIEALLKVTGRAIFAAETPAEGLLHAVLIEAPIARGKVGSIDASAARQVRGFVDLITHAETQGLAPLAHTALIRDATIHFRGQPVALAVGVTRSAAEAAAREVRVAYESEPAVIVFNQAIDQPLCRQE